jgi:glycosyltransferase involved in cell wall biosynthesis
VTEGEHLRIAWLVHQYLPDQIGGTELYTHGLARRARDEGHDALVITYREHPDADPAAWQTRNGEHEGVPVAEVEHNLDLAPSIARYEYDNPVVGEQVRETLVERQPDVVHCTHAMKLSAASLDACTELGIPFVITLCDFWFVCPRNTLLTWDGRLCEGPFDPNACWACSHNLHGTTRTPENLEAIRERPARLRGALERADRVIALSEFQRRMLAGAGVDAGLIEVIPHGLEPEGLDVPPRDRAGRPTRLLFIGSIAPHKGLHVLLEALRARPELVLELVVYGKLADGDPYVERIVAEAAGDDRVRLAGTFPPSEMGAILADADALMLPALWYENDPLVVKAALHVGIPAVVSRIGSLAEQVRDGEDGWTVPPGDVGAWAGALDRAGELRDRPRSPRPQPSMDEHYRRLAGIYAEAAGR